MIGRSSSMSDVKLHYGTSGITILNGIEYYDGRTVGTSIKDMSIGGTLYTLEGVKLWTDNCFFVGKAGKDFDSFYGDWFRDNGIPFDGITFTDFEHDIVSMVHYNEDGSHVETSQWEGKDVPFSTFDPLACTWEDFLSTYKEAKAYYVNFVTANPVWDPLFEMKSNSNFKLMWEVMARDCHPDAVKDICSVLERGIEMFSINVNESKALFDTDDRMEIIRRIREFPTDFTLLRDGENGLFTVTKERVAFIPIRRYHGPVQDPTGCGNSSTAAAMWALCEGYDDIMAGLIANTTAYYNVQQVGPVLKFDRSIREKELAYLAENRDKLSSVIDV